MRPTSLKILAVGLSYAVMACSAEPTDPAETAATGGSPRGGKAGGGSSGRASGGASNGGTTTAGASNAGASSGGRGGTAGTTATGGTTGGGNTGGGATGGADGGGAGGFMATGGTTAGSGTGGSGTGGTGFGGTGFGGRAAGGATASGGTTGGNTTGGAGANSGTGGTGGNNPLAEPDCHATMPSGGQLRSGNGVGGDGNLAWEIWSNTGQGQLTTFDVPAFIATWNNSGGYLGRLGFEWGAFGDEPVPHTERGEITAQFVSRKTGTAGGYSYVGMYGWTTNPCVEWYVVDDSYGNMPINPGMTTNEGEVPIDGGTYIMYTRPTTGTGGTRCSGVTDWMQYYSVRKTARACGVISLSEHFRAWQALGMDMTGELLEAKILVEVGGGVGNVQLPIANVTVQ
jgi:endo-1,4-beta-xylanase